VRGTEKQNRDEEANMRMTCKHEH